MRYLLTFAFSIVTILSYSQSTSGIFLAYNQHFGKSNTSIPALGLNWETNIGDNSLRFNFEFGLPFREKVYMPLYSIYTDEYVRDVEGYREIESSTFSVDYKYYFGEGSQEDGGFYTFGGLGISFLVARNHYNGYDFFEYYTPAEQNLSDFYFVPMVRAGFGKDFNLKTGNLFLQTYASVPYISKRTDYGMLSTNYSIGINFGYRIPNYILRELLPFLDRIPRYNPTPRPYHPNPRPVF